MGLARLYRKAFRRPIPTYWWRYEYPHKLNFGDEITPILFERIFNRPAVWTEPSKAEIAGVGSIIELLQQASAGNRLKIWGSGFIKPPEENQSESNMDFFAVRGKFTHDRTDKKARCLGDPALLLPLVYPSSKKKYKIGLVPHYVDSKLPVVKKISKLPGTRIIDVLSSPQEVIKQITSCELVFSSSLHGLIVSDAYKVPNYWTPLSNQLTGGDYKFKDYYSIYDMLPPKLNLSTFKPSQLENLIARYKTKNNLQLIQQQLIKSFPY